MENSVVIPPVFIAENVRIHNTVIGPHVSIGKGSKITNSVIRNSIVQENTYISNANIADSMLGNFVKFEGKSADLSLGDYNAVKE